MKLKDILKVIDSQQFVISSDDGFAYDKRDKHTLIPEPYKYYYVHNIWYSDLYKGIFIEISKTPKE